MNLWIGLTTGIVMLQLGTPSLAQDRPKYGEREVAELVELARAESEPEGRRARAIRELSQTAVRSHMGALRRLMREERSLDIRLSAAITLAMLDDRQAPVDLLLVSAYDRAKTPNCSRGAVLVALGRTRNEAAVLHLERALREEPPTDEPSYSADLCRALGYLNTAASRKLLLETLSSGRSEFRKASVQPLSQAVPTIPIAERGPIIQAIRDAARLDENADVASTAMSALLWNGVDGEGFFRLLGSDPSDAVRLRAAKTLGRHPLTPQRQSRVRALAARERNPEILAILNKVLDQTGL